MNPCPPVPEAVLVEGFTQFNSHFKFPDKDPQAGNTSRHQIMSQAKGVGLVTGVNYTFHEMYRSEGEYNQVSGVLKIDEMVRWHVISATDLGNFFATSRQKVTCDKNGCTAEPISFESDCRG